jgi:serine phosphatase RsbU (regulator of sigma subunit)
MGLHKPSGPDAWFAASLVLVAIVAVADVLDEGSSLAGAAGVAPLMASTLCSPVRTGIVSAVALVVGFSLVITQGEPEVLTIAVRAGVLFLAAVLAPVLATLRTRRERRISDLTKVAEVAQLAVLTPIPPVAGPTRLASAYQSASREALIGGDLYGVVETPRGVRLMIGDVRGKGIDAVRVAAVTLAAFRDGTLSRSSLADLADHCDERLRPHLVAEDFVTALFTDIDDDGRVELISCGHPAPMIARGDRWCEIEIATPGTPLGFPVELRSPPDPHRLQLEPGDRLLFYTDGLIEARTNHGRFVPPEQVVSDIGRAEFEQALGGVLARLHAATREVRDDLALLLVEYTGPTPGLDAQADAGDQRENTASLERPGLMGRVIAPLPATVPGGAAP